MKKIMLGMSGGVDSSVTAYLLQKEGYEVEGVYMKLHSASESYHRENLETISNVCEYLGIKYHILDLEESFKKEVYDYFIESYKEGITPNPCVKCNKTIKFGALLDFAKEHGADFLATGHYAKNDGKFIYVADDLSKDQSYFLSQVSPEALPFMMFPMSKYKKDDIKSIASTIPALEHLAVKKESQEICFVPTVYTDIMKKHVNIDQEGKTLDINGNEVGHHKGYMHYTVGKRKGFYVHGAHEPHFVLSTDRKNNTITVGKKEDLEINTVIVDNLNMYIKDKEFNALVKLRYRSPGQNASVTIDGDKATIKLNEPAFGVASGQFAVFYDGDKVLGSGIITQAKK
jgi:tRNA-specific 2-thiouridylase